MVISIPQWPCCDLQSNLNLRSTLVVWIMEPIANMQVGANQSIQTLWCVHWYPDSVPIYLSQWCLFMNPKVDFTIHTIETTDDPEQVPVIDGNIDPEIIQSQGTRSRWSRGPMNCQVIQMINHCQMSEIQCGLSLNGPSVPASGPANYYINFTIIPILTILLLLMRRNGSVWMDFYSPALSTQIVVFGCSQRLHHYNLFYPVHNNLEGSSAHQPPVHLQCVLEEKRVVPLPSAVLFWFQLTNVLQMYQDPLMEEGRFPKSSEMEDRPWRGM